MEFKDPVRQLIAERSAALNISHAELSRSLGRGASYLNQYLRRGSPVALDVAERAALARELKLDDSMLVPTLQASGTAAIVARAQILASSSKHIPVFQEDRGVDFERVREWTERPDFVALSEQSFALWIHHNHGRLVPGDLAFVSAGRPARIGDLVVVLTLDQRSIVTIGEVTKVAPDRVVLARPDQDEKIFARQGYVILRVVATRHA